MNFTEKYRPRKPEQLIGETQIKIAKRLTEESDPPQKILFIGNSGVGKTTIGEIYTRHILGLNPEEDISKYIHYYNCGFNTGVDFIREVTETFDYYPTLAKKKIYFLDEIHRLSQQAQDCLLTPLENLPDYVVIIAATTEQRKIVKTLKSRLTVYNLKSPKEKDLILKAKAILKREKPELVPFNQDTGKIVQEIIDRSDGNVRMFDDFLGQFVDGSYVSFDENDEEFFGFWFIFKAENYKIHEIFERADEITDYDGMAVAMSRMAYNTIRNNKARPNSIARCMKVLSVFGEGLSQLTDPKVSFATKLLELSDNNFHSG